MKKLTHDDAIKATMVLFTVSGVVGRINLNKKVYSPLLGGICIGTFIAGGVIITVSTIIETRRLNRELKELGMI